MANVISIALTMFGLIREDPARVSFSDIRSARRAVFCESCPAGRLKVIAAFRMKVEQPNPAIGVGFFPISDLTGTIVNLSDWREETSRSGRRYKQRVINPIPPSYRGPFPGTYDLTVCFNGSRSWRYRPKDMTAEAYEGVQRGTQVVQDFYGDMIGSKIPVAFAELSITVPAPSDDIYDIDQIIDSDLYKVIGEEIIAGEACTIIERPGVDRIWLVNGKNYPVARREWRWSADGPLKRRIINSNFRQIGDGAWLPYECRMEIFSHPSTPPERRVGVLTAVVESADTSFPDSEFEPGFLKGTFIMDGDTGKRTVAGYTEEEWAIEEAKKMLGKVRKKEAVEGLAFRVEPWWRRRWREELAGLTILAVAAVAFLGHRRRGA